MAALADATTGYPNDVADWTDTTPQMGSSDSGTDIGTYNFIPLTPMSMDGRYIDIGGTPRNIFIKTFEADTNPTLSLTGALTAVAFMVAATLTFTANLLLSAQLLKRFPMAFAAVTAFQGMVSKQTNTLRSGTVSFSAAVNNARQMLLNAALSFIGSFQKTVIHPLRSMLSFIGSIVVHPFNLYLTLESVVRFRGAVSTSWNNIVTFISLIAGQAFDKIIGRSDFRVRVKTAVDVQQLVTTTPGVLSFGSITGPPLVSLFIKNLDSDNTVLVDTVDTFGKFAQVIPPGEAIYLVPKSSDTIYAKSLTGSAQIQVIAAI